MYTPKRLRKNPKEITSDPTKPKRKRVVLNFKEKEEVTQKLKMGYTPDKLAADYGLNPHTVYK